MGLCSAPAPSSGCCLAHSRGRLGLPGDRSGHLRVLALGTLIWAAAQVLLLASTDPLALLAFFTPADRWFSDGRERLRARARPGQRAALRLAAVDATQAIAAIAPLLGGVLGASWASLVFGVAVAAQCLAWVSSLETATP